MFVILISAMRIRQREYTKLIKHQLQTDLMTGLLNRGNAKAEIERWITLSKESQCSFLIIDIDDHNGINNHLGHAIGEEAIRSMAYALQKQFRAADIIGRIGGVEFRVFLMAVGTKEAVVAIHKCLVDAITSVPLGDGKRYLNGSIGVSMTTAGETDIETFTAERRSSVYHEESQKERIRSFR